MQFTILTLFPEMFSGPFDYSIVSRAQEKNIVSINYVNIRDFAEDKHKSVDDRPYGGGAGMILRVDVVDRALQSVRRQSIKVSEHQDSTKKELVVLLDPRGKTYTQSVAEELATYEHIILLCGHYEGVDERIRDLVDEQISIGDYIVTGGEIPSMIIVDSITRLLGGVLVNPQATKKESFHGLLEYPQYTRPARYKGKTVPDVLLSGNHKQITEWETQEAKKITAQNRPDLMKK
jgi:tRNA (guanine37-N1)-methyltransferase